MFNVYIRHNKRLTTITNNKIELYCNTSCECVLALTVFLYGLTHAFSSCDDVR